MKQLLLLSAFFLAGQNIMAQFVFSQDTFDVNGGLGDNFEETFSISNTADVEASFYWTIEEEAGTPAEWSYKLCDYITCIDTLTILNSNCSNADSIAVRNTLSSGQTYDFMSLKLNPNGVKGNYTIRWHYMAYCNDGSPTEKLATLVFNYNVTGGVNTDDVLSTFTPIVFPNPSENHFSLTNDEEVSFVHLYSLLGNKLRTYIHYPGRNYDIASLEKGVYFVRMERENARVINSTRLVKQ